MLIIQADLQPSSRIHGPNQWPSQLPEFEATTREYVQRMLPLGHALMRGETSRCRRACPPVPSLYLHASDNDAGKACSPLLCAGMGAGMGVTRFPGEPANPDESYWWILLCR
jgi:hypothetical protein